MKIAVISDSHGNKKAIDKIVNNYKFDHLIFLGDGVDDIGNYCYLPNVHIVKGNCDFFDDNPLELTLDFDGVKVFVAHGHKYWVKSTLGLLVSEAKKQSANVVLFGHTHRFTDTIVDGIRLINPGSLGKTMGKNSSFAMLEINNGEVVVKHIIL